MNTKENLLKLINSKDDIEQSAFKRIFGHKNTEITIKEIINGLTPEKLDKAYSIFA